MSDENSDLVLSEARQEMQKSLSGLGHDLSKIRTGRANPALLEGLSVDPFNFLTFRAMRVNATPPAAK